MAANPQTSAGDLLAAAANDSGRQDPDQQETREWLDALAAVIEREGA